MSPPTDDINLSRRAFMRGASLSRARQASLGPAPPWHQGKLEIDRCQHCDAPCVSACEQSIIKRHPDSHLLAGVPYLSFEERGCTFCGECVTACPMALDAKQAEPKLGLVKLEIATCLAWNGVFCISCRSHCDYAAISLDVRMRVQLNEDACNGCGRCLAVCPNQSLHFHPKGD